MAPLERHADTDREGGRRVEQRLHRVVASRGAGATRPGATVGGHRQAGRVADHAVVEADRGATGDHHRRCRHRGRHPQHLLGQRLDERVAGERERVGHPTLHRVEHTGEQGGSAEGDENLPGGPVGVVEGLFDRRFGFGERRFGLRLVRGERRSGHRFDVDRRTDLGVRGGPHLLGRQVAQCLAAWVAGRVGADDRLGHLDRRCGRRSGGERLQFGGEGDVNRGERCDRCFQALHRWVLRVAERSDDRLLRRGLFDIGGAFDGHVVLGGGQFATHRREAAVAGVGHDDAALAVDLDVGGAGASDGDLPVLVLGETLG